VHTVLVVADNLQFVHQVLGQLQPEGFRAEVASAGADALARLDRPGLGVGLVLLDIAMRVEPPSPSTRELCRSIRERWGVPLLVLSSDHRGDHRGDELVDYLDAGADDYLPRSDRLRELVARIRALLRRWPSVMPDGFEAMEAHVLRVGDVALDAERHEVVIRGRRVDLPLKQFQLLELLLANAGHVLTRATILRRVWGTESPTDSNTLEVQVKRLRQHVEDDPANPTRIRTIRGLGYVYADERSRL
jgi:two-component system response regulator RegX3